MYVTAILPQPAAVLQSPLIIKFLSIDSAVIKTQLQAVSRREVQVTFISSVSCR